MPTLIRLVVILLVLAGLVYGGMFALVALVEPPDKEITIRIPARDLLPTRTRDPLVRREIDTGRTVESPAPAEAEPAELAPAEPETPVEPVDTAAEPEVPADDGSIVTLSPGIE